MLAIKHILFPVDFSERCCGAVPFVDAFATRFHAKVTLISAAQPFAYATLADPGGPVVVNVEEVLNDLKARLGEFLAGELSHIQTERVAELGDPSRTIVDFAHNNGVDLIMMPTHGYGPFRNLLLGSVTAKVLHDAHCPVWTGAHMEEEPAREHIHPKNILCAVDGTPKSVPIMQWSSALSGEIGASLRLVHVIPSVEGWPVRAVDRQSEEDIRQNARRTVDHLQISAGVTAPLCVASGNIAEGVREEARRHGADLIVIGRGTLHETLGRLRTHAYGIIRHAPCPVISV